MNKYDNKLYIWWLGILNRVKCLFGTHRLDYACLICGLKCKCGHKHYNNSKHNLLNKLEN